MKSATNKLYNNFDQINQFQVNKNTHITGHKNNIVSLTTKNDKDNQHDYFKFKHLRKVNNPSQLENDTKIVIQLLSNPKPNIRNSLNFKSISSDKKRLSNIKINNASGKQDNRNNYINVDNFDSVRSKSKNKM